MQMEKMTFVSSMYRQFHIGKTGLRLTYLRRFVYHWIKLLEIMVIRILASEESHTDMYGKSVTRVFGQLIA
jgi:hypothetical protein